jgi:vacuolar protein sorting-associated protein 41
MVHLLDRMGKHEEALHLIVDKLGDIKRAVDFVYQLRDLDDNRKLWELLIKKSLERAELISELLENAGGHIINPAKLIEQVCGCFVAHCPGAPFPSHLANASLLLAQQIPEKMHIFGLKKKVIKIISDYTLQLQLRSGCNKILKTDSVNLTRQLYKAQRKAIRVDPGATCPLSDELVIQRSARRSGKSTPKAVWFGNGRVYSEEALRNDLTVPRDSPHWQSIQIYRNRQSKGDA